MAIDVEKPSVDESVVKYQARTVLLQLAYEIAQAGKLSRVQDKINKAYKIVCWLKALDFDEWLTYDQKYMIVYKLLEISGVNDFPTSPVLELRTRPNILIGGGSSTGSVIAGNNQFVFGTGTGITSRPTFTANEDVLVNFSTTPSTINSVGLINNTFVFSERSTLTPVSLLTNVFSTGDWHFIGDGSNAFSGSGTFTVGSNNNNYGGNSFVAGAGAQVNYGGVNSGGVAIALDGDNDRNNASYKRVLAGPAALNISHNTVSQVLGHGALALYSAIIVGQDGNIPVTSPRSVVIGGNGIKARPSDPDQIYVPNFNIGSTPLNDNALVQILARDASTGQIKYRNSATLINPDALILETTMTRTATDFVDRLTLVNLEYDYTTNQTFRVQTYGTGSPNDNVGFQVDALDTSAALLANDSAGRQGYFKVFNPSALQAKAISATNSITMDIQAGSWATIGTGSNNVWTLNGFKSGQFNFTGVNAGFGVNVNNSGGSSGLINFTVTNTTATEPLIMLLTQNTSATPINSGIRLFGTSATGNVIVAKNTIGDSQWGSINLASSAAVGTSRLAYTNLAQGLALSILGVTGNATADNNSIAGTADQVLRINGAGTSLAFGAIDLSKVATVGSSILAVANGGTGSATQNFVDLTTNQTIAGRKTFSPTATISGLNIGAGVSGDPSSLVDGDLYISTTTGLKIRIAGATQNIARTTASGTGPIMYHQGSGFLNSSNNFIWANATNQLQIIGTQLITATSPADYPVLITLSGTGPAIANMGIVNIGGTLTMQNTSGRTYSLFNTVANYTTSNTNQVMKGVDMNPTFTANHTGGVLRGFYWNPTIAGTQAGSVNHLSMEIISGTALMKASLAASLGPSATNTALGSETVQIRSDQNANTYLQVYNGTAGTAAQSAINVAITGGYGLILSTFSSSYTSSGMSQATKAVISENASGGLNIGTLGGVPLQFWTGNTLRGQFDSNGVFIVGTGIATSGSVLADFQSTTLGVLMPRVTNIASVSTPVNGMIAYDAATNKFNFRENGAWSQISTGAPWLLASGGTDTGNNIFAFGSNTFQATSSVAGTGGAYNWSNSFTATAINQKSSIWTGTITGRGTASDVYAGQYFNTGFTTGAASQGFSSVFVDFVGVANHANTVFAALDITTNISGTNVGTASNIGLRINSGAEFRTTGKAYFGSNTVSPAAAIHIAAGSTLAGTAPLKFTSGSNLTTAEAGAVEYDGTNFFVTNSTPTRYTLAKTLTATAVLNFPSTGSGVSSDLTITVTGAATGDVVILGVPAAAVNANSCYTAWVSAANTVTVRFNNYSIAAIDPASATFRVSILQY